MTLLRGEDLTAAFGHASRSYDALTAANPGYRAHFRRSVRRLGLPATGRPCLLDLGCGTGASTARLPRRPAGRAHHGRRPPPACCGGPPPSPGAGAVTFVRGTGGRLAEPG